MEVSLHEARKRKDELEELIKNKMHEIKRLQDKLPQGTIRAVKHHGTFQYYYRKSSNEKNGIYIPKQKERMAADYSSLEYCNKVVRAAEEELMAIESLLRFYDNHVSPENVYCHMPLGKQILINPIQKTDEEYISSWLRENEPSNSFLEELKTFETSFGEKVRSKSEVLIAELYKRKGIPFLYEKPLELDGYGIVRPDYTFLDMRRRVEIYHEHLGLVDDEDYRNNAIKKIRFYEKNGLYIGDRLLITCETQRYPLDIKAVERAIDRFMK